MKRSEVIRNIQDELEYYLLIEHQTHYNMELLAKSVLDKLEGSGMMPKPFKEDDDFGTHLVYGWEIDK